MDALRIEEMGLNAWPGLRTYLYDGWVIRLANGYTGRANSATALYDGRLPLAEKIVAVERYYHRYRQPAIFRMLSFRPESAELEERLIARGYKERTGALVQGCSLNDVDLPAASEPLPAVRLDEFLAAYDRLQGTPTNPIHRKILRQAAGIPRFVCLERDGQTAGVGMAVLTEETVGLFDIVTHPDQRRRGVGQQVVADLLRWGITQGAKTAYLQVVEENRPARALYQKLGFHTLYHYRYRQEDR